MQCAPTPPDNLTLVVGSSFKAFFSTSMDSLYSPLSDRSWEIRSCEQTLKRADKSHPTPMSRNHLPGLDKDPDTRAPSSPFLSWTRPWHCSAPGSERPGCCSAPLQIAPAWAEWRPGCSDTWLCSPAPPLPRLPSRCRRHHLCRRVTQPGRTFISPALSPR